MVDGGTVNGVHTGVLSGWYDKIDLIKCLLNSYKLSVFKWGEEVVQTLSNCWISNGVFWTKVNTKRSKISLKGQSKEMVGLAFMIWLTS